MCPFVDHIVFIDKTIDNYMLYQTTKMKTKQRFLRADFQINSYIQINVQCSINIHQLFFSPQHKIYVQTLKM